MKTSRPSDLELQVLAVLWESGPMTVRTLLDAMPDGKRRAYTTMLSVLQVMEKKGLATHDRMGLAYVYRPAVDRPRVVGALLRQLLRNVFGGSPAKAVQSLLSASDLDSDELAKVRKLIAGVQPGRSSEKGGERE